MIHCTLKAPGKTLINIACQEEPFPQDPSHHDKNYFHSAQHDNKDDVWTI